MSVHFKNGSTDTQRMYSHFSLWSLKTADLHTEPQQTSVTQAQSLKIPADSQENINMSEKCCKAKVTFSAAMFYHLPLSYQHDTNWEHTS